MTDLEKRIKVLEGLFETKKYIMETWAQDTINLKKDVAELKTSKTHVNYSLALGNMIKENAEVLRELLTEADPKPEPCKWCEVKADFTVLDDMCPGCIFKYLKKNHIGWLKRELEKYIKKSEVAGKLRDACIDMVNDTECGGVCAACSIGELRAELEGKEE